MALLEKLQKAIYTSLLFFLFVTASGQRTIEVFPVKTLPAIDGKYDDIDTLFMNFN